MIQYQRAAQIENGAYLLGNYAKLSQSDKMFRKDKQKQKAQAHCHAKHRVVGDGDFERATPLNTS